jgi:hypothetical protein
MPQQLLPLLMLAWGPELLAMPWQELPQLDWPALVLLVLVDWLLCLVL